MPAQTFYNNEALLSVREKLNGNADVLNVVEETTESLQTVIQDAQDNIDNLQSSMDTVEQTTQNLQTSMQDIQDYIEILDPKIYGMQTHIFMLQDEKIDKTDERIPTAEPPAGKYWGTYIYDQQSIPTVGWQDVPRGSISDELLKFTAYPTFNDPANTGGDILRNDIKHIYINNQSNVITAGNGYSLAWQVLNTKKYRSGTKLDPETGSIEQVRHTGGDKKNFWTSITGDLPKGNTGTDKYALLRPLKDDISTGLYTDVIRSNDLSGNINRIVQVVSKSSHGIRSRASIRGLGRPYDFVFNHPDGEPNIKKVDIQIRLALIASSKQQGSEGIILRNIRTVKVVWQGLARIATTYGGGGGGKYHLTITNGLTI
jgi:hypothetical protein